jgi:alkylation response protein AidB-like acyl-CoA dehydrogenase
MWKVARRTQALLSFEVKFYHISGVLYTFVDSIRLAIAMRLILGIWKCSPSLAGKSKQKWLVHLLNGVIRSFLMTEPQVASSDATDIELTMRREGNDYILSGQVSPTFSKQYIQLIGVEIVKSWIFSFLMAKSRLQILAHLSPV